MPFELMAPLMFAGLVVFLLLGYPVAFSLAANGLLFGLIGIAHGSIEPALLQALPERVFGIMSNSTLLAIPFFTFMGLILERSGMAEELLDTVGQLFGSVRGGVAYAVVFVGALLAATTGVVAASVLDRGNHGVRSGIRQLVELAPQQRGRGLGIAPGGGEVLVAEEALHVGDLHPEGQ